MTDPSLIAKEMPLKMWITVYRVQGLPIQLDARRRRHHAQRRLPRRCLLRPPKKRKRKKRRRRKFRFLRKKVKTAGIQIRRLGIPQVMVIPMALIPMAPQAMALTIPQVLKSPQYRYLLQLSQLLQRRTLQMIPKTIHFQYFSVLPL